MKTYFAISDVHGADLTIMDFEVKGFNVEDEDHYIVFLGDLFDRGKHNTQVLDLVLQLKEEIGERCITIMGNHEEMLIDVLEKVIEYGDTSLNELNVPSVYTDLYKYNGGDTTLREFVGGTLYGTYSFAKDRRLKNLLSFLKTFVPYYKAGSFTFTHAYLYEETMEADTWETEALALPRKHPGWLVVGHVRHDHIEYKTKLPLLKDEMDGTQLVNPYNKVINIDDGTGKNICLFYD